MNILRYKEKKKANFYYQEGFKIQVIKKRSYKKSIDYTTVVGTTGSALYLMNALLETQRNSPMNTNLSSTTAPLGNGP